MTQEMPVVVVGGGLAGLTAANVAASRGRQVIVVEKGVGEDYPCNSRIATGVLGLAHSDPTDSPDVLYRAIMDDTENYASPELASLLASNAGRALRWLRDEKISVIKALAANRIRWVLAPPKAAKPGHDWKGRGPDLALQTLNAESPTEGRSAARLVRARRLVMENGNCVGVVVDCDGQSEQISASAVILADGGFQANSQLLRELITERPDSLAQRNAMTGEGDALLMAREVGAQLTDMQAFYGHLLARNAIHNRELWPYPTIDTLASCSVLVDADGRRFIDEGLGGIPLSNAIARLPDPLSAFAIFDDEIWNIAGKAEFISPNPYVELLGGEVIRASSLDELARLARLPAANLAHTVAIYNQSVQSNDLKSIDPPRSPGRSFGELRSSTRRLDVKPVRTPPFYAIPLCAGISYTLGGVAIDAHACVLDNTNMPIPGLYAVGSCTGGLEGGPIAGYVGGLMKALCTGLIAGEAC